MRRFELLNEICKLSLVLRVRLHLALFKKIWWYKSCHMVNYGCYFDEIRTTPLELGTLTVSYQMQKSTKDPDFLKKCQMYPISQDQWQIAKFFLEFKSTHPMGIIFDGIIFGSIFSLLKDLFHNVFCAIWDGRPCRMYSLVLVWRAIHILRHQGSIFLENQLSK